MSLPYRPNVGVALFNRSGLVFAGRSISAGPEIIEPGLEWQMPQGGIERDETSWRQPGGSWPRRRASPPCPCLV